jgi:hypothetical protein
MSEKNWWSEYREEKDKQEEMCVALASFGKAIQAGMLESPVHSSSDPSDIVLVQEHGAELARIEARRQVLMAFAPSMAHAVSAAVGATIGSALAFAWCMV